MSDLEVQKKENSELLQLVTFIVGNEEFAVDIILVHEIIRMIQITKVPNSPDFVDGVINLRGRIIPVINLRYKIGLEKKPTDKNTRIIVVEVNNNTIGFIVDSVREVLRIPESITEAPPELTTNINSNFIKSVGKLDDRLIILIDIQKVISTEEQNEISQANLSKE
ncbi:MAG: chemotaxis protein CheW [Bacteroidota bacterium]|nr:chemotaxis protein CheW [Bacteroidota bacterium]